MQQSLVEQSNTCSWLVPTKVRIDQSVEML